MTSCRSKLFPLNEPESSKISQFIDNDFHMFLTYGDLSGSYEFVVCDAHAVDNDSTYRSIPTQECPPTRPHCQRALSRKPDYCVSAYLSTPIEQLCSEYPNHRYVCANQDNITAFCKNPQEPSPHLGILPSQCPDFAYLPSICAQVMPVLTRPCEALQSKQSLCVQSQDSQSQSCQEADAHAQSRIPFYLYTLDIPPARRQSIHNHLKYEEFLTHKNAAHQKHFFGSGTIMAMLNRHTFRQYVRVLPDIPRMDRQFQIAGKNIGAKQLVAGSAVSGSVVSLYKNNDAIKYLYAYSGYTPVLRCLNEMLRSKQAPDSPYPVEKYQDMEVQFKQAIIPFFSGVGTNLTISKITANAPPIVGIGTMLIFPFFTIVYGNNPEERATQELTTHLKKMLSLQASPTRVHEIKRILPVFGRSLAITDVLQSIEKYCVPKKQSDGSYRAQCEPILEHHDGWIADMIQKTPTASSLCQQLVEHRLEVLYPHQRTP